MIKKIIDYVKDEKLKIIYYDNSINIVNYDNILEIKDTEITIIKNKKVIIIKGNDLKLNKLLDREVLITGIINKIEL